MMHGKRYNGAWFHAFVLLLDWLLVSLLEGTIYSTQLCAT